MLHCGVIIQQSTYIQHAHSRPWIEDRNEYNITQTRSNQICYIFAGSLPIEKLCVSIAWALLLSLLSRIHTSHFTAPNSNR